MFATTPPRDADDLAAWWCDRALDAVAAVLATWTLAYHLCLLLRLGTTAALGITAVGLAAGVFLERRTRGGTAPVAAPAGCSAARPSRVSDRVLVRVLAGAALVAALATAANALWVLVWVPWLLAAVAGAGLAVRRVGDPVPGTVGRSARAGGLTALVVGGWALGLAALAACLLRGNPDDLYYLNLSQWVATHGTFPLRDTLYADLVYPMSNWPPTASYDALVGTAARLAGVRAGSVEYLVVPPLVTALSVLALWRLLRAWRVERVPYALSVALLFLLFDGSLGYGAPGSLFVSRLWQGKIVLLCLVVPLILARSVNFAERPSRRGAAGLAVTGAAAVGLSTTALFLVPVLALAGAAPLARRAPRWAAAGFLATSAYALAGVAVTLAVGGRSADQFGQRRLYRFDPSWIGHQIFLTGPLTVATVAAVLLAAVLIPHPAARVTSALLVLATGLVLTPGVVPLLFRVTGLGPTLWRLSWGCAIAALVGVGAVVLSRWLGPRLPQRWPVGVAGLLVPVCLVVLGEPVWAAGGATWTDPTHWKRSDAELATTRTVLDRSAPGDIVLAPDPLAITIAVTTTTVKTVTPRDYYMAYLRDRTGFHYRARLRLAHYANEGPWHPRAVRRALDIVDVRTVCLSEDDAARGTALDGTRYAPIPTPFGYQCWQSP